uniref:Uncharacterized protein n=1 Tax=viral metagenome TaxID=1070528 RepID=A0A6C0J9Y0_9ZZZZ
MSHNEWLNYQYMDQTNNISLEIPEEFPISSRESPEAIGNRLQEKSGCKKCKFISIIVKQNLCYKCISLNV